MKYGALLGAFIGIVLSIWLLDSYGVGQILRLLKTVGWIGASTIIAFHAWQVFFSALGWREIARPSARWVRLSTYVELRWLREGVNNLLPFAQIGGEFVAARLLQRRGTRLEIAIAGTMADLTLEIATQILFTCLGVVILLFSVGDSVVARYLISGLGVTCLLVAAGAVALRLGVAALVGRAFLTLAGWMGCSGAGGVEGFNAALLACYADPLRVAGSAAWHMLSWLMGGVEVGIACHFLGHDLAIGPALVVESVGQALKAAGFFVPGALGIQEGGYVLICRAFGLSPELAIALSLLKRLRELVLGIPALVYWQLLERGAGRSSAVLPGTNP